MDLSSIVDSHNEWMVDLSSSAPTSMVGLNGSCLDNVR